MGFMVQVKPILIVVENADGIHVRICNSVHKIEIVFLNCVSIICVLQLAAMMGFTMDLKLILTVVEIVHANALSINSVKKLQIVIHNISASMDFVNHQHYSLVPVHLHPQVFPQVFPPVCLHLQVQVRVRVHPQVSLHQSVPVCHHQRAHRPVLVHRLVHPQVCHHQ